MNIDDLTLKQTKSLQSVLSGQQNIKEPVLCWVSNKSPSDRIWAARVIWKENRFYSNDRSFAWKYATPVKPEDLL